MNFNVTFGNQSQLLKGDSLLIDLYLQIFSPHIECIISLLSLPAGWA